MGGKGRPPSGLMAQGLESSEAKHFITKTQGRELESLHGEGTGGPRAANQQGIASVARVAEGHVSFLIFIIRPRALFNSQRT